MDQKRPTNGTQLENKQSPALSRVDIVQSLIHPSVSHHPERYCLIILRDIVSRIKDCAMSTTAPRYLQCSTLSTHQVTT